MRIDALSGLLKDEDAAARKTAVLALGKIPGQERK